VPWWSWIVLGAALLGAEVLLSTDFYLVFFGVAAVIVGLIDLGAGDLPVWSQWLLFATIAILGLALYRRRLRERLTRPDRAVDESVVGQTAVVRGAIRAGSTGRAELRGSMWQARNAVDGDLADGEECRVAAVEGLTLRLERRAGRP
jgi:membrane protein implicated in regulation of membrane protease activity